MSSPALNDALRVLVYSAADGARAGRRIVMLKLNLGCGPVQPAGWINIDNSRRARLASSLPFVDRALVRVGLLNETEFNDTVSTANLFKRLPWSDNTVQAIYGGEVLEHFTREDGLALLRECYRVLAPGGVLRMRVPDNAAFWRNYLREYETTRAKPRGEWTDGHSRWVGMFFREICVRPQALKSFGHFHKWMYDDVSLILTFERVGLTAVERRAYHDSRIADVQAVEVRDDLIVEGVKPAVNG